MGGVGFKNLNNLQNENIVALCDVDWEYGQKAFRRWANAAKYTDFRKMLDRELFVGPSAFTPYHETYTPYGWRAFWNFGSGVPGSVAPHILEPVFRALKLMPASAVEASSTYMNLDVAPKAGKIVFEFNRRDNLPKVAMPPVKIHWCDGGLLPEFPANLPSTISMSEFSDGMLMIGSEGILLANPLTGKYFVIKDGEIVNPEVPKIIHRIENSSNGHEADWVRACKEPAGNRLLCAANFESQQALSETIQVGNMAVRMQSLKRKLQWDSTQMKFSNIDIFEEFEITSPTEFSVENGLSKFNKTVKRINAAHFADQTVRPIYREGWKQI